MTDEDLKSLRQVFAFHEKLIQSLREELRKMHMRIAGLHKRIKRIAAAESERRSRASRDLKALLTQLLEEKTLPIPKLPAKKRNTKEWS